MGASDIFFDVGDDWGEEEIWGLEFDVGLVFGWRRRESKRFLL